MYDYITKGLISEINKHIDDEDMVLVFSKINQMADIRTEMMFARNDSRFAMDDVRAKYGLTIDESTKLVSSDRSHVMTIASTRTYNYFDKNRSQKIKTFIEHSAFTPISVVDSKCISRTNKDAQIEITVGDTNHNIHIITVTVLFANTCDRKDHLFILV